MFAGNDVISSSTCSRVVQDVGQLAIYSRATSAKPTERTIYMLSTLNSGESNRYRLAPLLTMCVNHTQLMIELLSRLNGSYALLVKSAHYPGELIACKKGSPLILGIKQEGRRSQIACRQNHVPKPLTLSPRRKSSGKKIQSTAAHVAILASRCALDERNDTDEVQSLQYFLSSDPAAIIEHTDQVIVLEDGDMVHISDGELLMYDAPSSAGANPVTRKHPELIRLDMNVEQIMKGDYDHFMQKEIFEQPETLLQTMKGRVILPEDSSDSKEHPLSVKLGGLVEYLDTVRRCGRLVIVACGTSYNAGLACRPALEKLVQMPVSMELASDLLDRPTPIFRNDTCIFLSQSGETADTLRSLELALERGALCVGITNTVGSAISRRTHCGVHINAGAEIGVASTKAYTSQIVVLLLLALALSGDSISSQSDRQTIMKGLGAVSTAVKKTLGLDASITKLAEKLKDEHSLLIFGRGSNYATAIEGALKVKEVSLMHSEGILAGEMKHGPLALVDEHMPIVVIATPDSLYGKMISVIEQLRARGANLIVICSEDDTEIAQVTGPDAVLLPVPFVSEYVQPIVNIVPLQLLSYHLAIKRPHKVTDVDRPPNLVRTELVEPILPSFHPSILPRPVRSRCPSVPRPVWQAKSVTVLEE
jgi:glucosamine--fructose-6-phosphate aminotransferase (isomerizing)